MRKYLSIFMVLILALGLCVPALAAEDGVGFVITEPGRPPAAGETFTVSVELTGNREFSAVQFTLRYNEEEMDCTEIALGELLSGALAASNPDAGEGAIVAAASLSPMRAGGTIAVLTFTAKTDVTDFGFVLTDVVVAAESGEDVPYTVANTRTESPAPPSGGSGQERDPADAPSDTSAGDPADAPYDIPEDVPAPDIPPADARPGETAALFPEAAPSFPDAAGHWGEAFISRAAALGLFRGYADGSFHPNEKVTRAQFVTVLWRLAGRPAPAGAAPFADTAFLSQEFRDAIAWGYERQYVNGKSDVSFDPNGVLTRQEAMTILFRYSGGVSGMEAMFTGIYDAQFADSGQVAAWAKPAMYWGIYYELISGTGENNLSPGTDATRAQLAKIMVQYTDQYQKEAGK